MSSYVNHYTYQTIQIKKTLSSEVLLSKCSMFLYLIMKIKLSVISNTIHIEMKNSNTIEGIFNICGILNIIGILLLVRGKWLIFENTM